jgi:hypothetical protein
MRRYFSLFIVLSFGFNCFAQRSQIAALYSRYQNYLPVEGGSIYMRIDSTTALNDLIDRLSGNWRFIETGKSYWIGYTNDMFSIAARGNSAIAPLVNVVENSSSRGAKLGAIYTIHLIGIHRTIVGRFDEQFVDTNARNALLYLLKYPEWQPTIMTLLIRDPWKSDVSTLIESLRNIDSDCWAIVGGLNQYKLGNAPFQQDIPYNLRNMTIKIRYSNPNVLEHNFDFEGQMQEVFDFLIGLKNDSIIVEKALLGQPLWGNIRSKLGDADSGDHFLTLSVHEFLHPWSRSLFHELGNKFQYYVDNGKLYLCSAYSAKKRWIGWWNNEAGNTL